jgi:putative endonuclease
MSSKSEKSKLYKRIGKIGEKIALKFLKENGYEIVSHNSRYREGEIDIIFFDKEEIVFCEVKTRQYNTSFLPEYSITKKKIESIKKASMRFLCENNYENMNIRFDGIFIFYTLGTKFAIKKIEHIKDIF